MSIDWNAIAQEWHDDQPHPLNPRLKVGQFAQAVKLATRTKFGGHASPEEAGAFHVEYQAMNDRLEMQGKEPISPEEYTKLLDRIAPHSFALQGRPPTMDEMVRHRDAEPSTVAKFYGDLPDRIYPHVTSRDMAKYLTLAEPFAKMHLDRYPNRLEAARFALGGLNASGIGDYYQAILHSTEGGLWRPQPGGFGAPPEEPGGEGVDHGDWRLPRTWEPPEGGFGARKGPEEGEAKEPDAPQQGVGPTE